jgi:hypothetical protein
MRLAFLGGEVFTGVCALCRANDVSKWQLGSSPNSGNRQFLPASVTDNNGEQKPDANGTKSFVLS